MLSAITVGQNISDHKKQMTAEYTFALLDVINIAKCSLEN